ncbi:MAG TPA: hypothetical protein VGY30_03240 [Solirubrobacteraceae bacterium]|nr:hypothetical protein [Solirubrobacteraceae bacterium]
MFMVGVGLLACELAISIAGCGAATSSNAGRSATAVVAVTAPTQVPAGAPAKAPSAPTRAVLDQVNVVCAAVLHGWPAALRPPYTVAKLTRYARAAAPPTTRVDVSLGRLRRLGDARALSTLGSGWRQLQALLGAAGSVAAHSGTAATVGRQLVMHQEALSALALQNRLPACGVAVAR